MPSGAIRRTRAHLLFLPLDSTDLNLIEQFFAELTHLMRAGRPRAVEATWGKVGNLLDVVSPAECANSVTNSGCFSM